MLIGRRQVQLDSDEPAHNVIPNLLHHAATCRSLGPETYGVTPHVERLRGRNVSAETWNGFGVRAEQLGQSLVTQPHGTWNARAL